MDISNKAKVIYATMEKLGAIDNENKITSYAILDYIIEESEELQEHELLKDIPEDDYNQRIEYCSGCGKKLNWKDFFIANYKKYNGLNKIIKKR